MQKAFLKLNQDKPSGAHIVRTLNLCVMKGLTYPMSSPSFESFFLFGRFHFYLLPFLFQLQRKEKKRGEREGEKGEEKGRREGGEREERREERGRREGGEREEERGRGRRGKREERREGGEERGRRGEREERREGGEERGRAYIIHTCNSSVSLK